MAEAVDLEAIGKNDVKKFIIKLQYGEEAYRWPRGKGSTIVLCAVEIYYTKSSWNSIEDCKLTRKRVYKNGVLHAEGYFLSDLRKEINALLNDKEVTVSKMQAYLVQNYSPCNNSSRDRKSGCADDILKFKAEIAANDIDFSWTIQFANFYRHTDISNREGLKKLLRNDIELLLLQGEDAWKAFLNNTFLKNTFFVELTDVEKNELLERANSEERKNREKDDKEILAQIEREASDEGLEDLDLSKLNLN